jgi:hypothetical protein
LSDTQPDLGLASTPVEDQRYVEGREHWPGVVVVVVVGLGLA